MPDLNCRPGQRAWIRVPSTPANERLGLTALNGHVVQTVRLLPGVGHCLSWVVDPPQKVRLVGPFPPETSKLLRPGAVHTCEGIPDAYLRPFEDFPPEELRELERELAT